jgi:hypothetical protein
MKNKGAIMICTQEAVQPVQKQYRLQYYNSIYLDVYVRATSENEAAEKAEAALNEGLDEGYWPSKPGNSIDGYDVEEVNPAEEETESRIDGTQGILVLD